MEQEKLLFRVGKILNGLKIPYIITGGMAVVVWGRPRFTADIDVVIELVPQKIDEIFSELKKIDKNIYVDKKMIRRALEQNGEFNLKRYSPSLRARGRRKFPSMLFLGHETLSNRFSFPLHNLLPHRLLPQISPKDFQGVED